MPIVRDTTSSTITVEEALAEIERLGEERRMKRCYEDERVKAVCAAAVAHGLSAMKIKPTLARLLGVPLGERRVRDWLARARQDQVTRDQSGDGGRDELA